MKKNLCAFVYTCCFVCLAACDKPPKPAPVASAVAPVVKPVVAPEVEPEVVEEVAFRHLDFKRPVFFCAVPGTEAQVCVVEQQGKVWLFKNDAAVMPKDRVLAVDLTDVVLAPGNKAFPGGNEEGLLGLAFHPQFAKNRLVYLYYSVMAQVPGKSARQRRGRLACFKADGAGVLDRASAKVLLEVDQPQGNHNGGMIVFGPDGMLYWGLGDGGGGGDKHGALGNGQKTNALLGKILRLDVDHADAKRQLAYAIPADNPFVNNLKFAPEIWALGMRNPWRFSFDRQTGELWCGDVGQNAHEEIDLIPKGGNCGWRVREGKFPFAGKESLAPGALVEPLVDHSHKEAKSITGGYVYRGQDIAGLDGWYVYGDYATGSLWRIKRGEAGSLRGPVRLPFVLKELSSFGEDAKGEIYACVFDGNIYRLEQR